MSDKLTDKVGKDDICPKCGEKWPGPTHWQRCKILTNDGSQALHEMEKADYKEKGIWPAGKDWPIKRSLTLEYEKECELCRGTGWYGDNGAGIEGNRECVPCECGVDPYNYALDLINKKNIELARWRECTCEAHNPQSGYISAIDRRACPYCMCVELRDENQKLKARIKLFEDAFKPTLEKLKNE